MKSLLFMPQVRLMLARQFLVPVPMALTARNYLKPFDSYSMTTK